MSDAIYGSAIIPLVGHRATFPCVLRSRPAAGQSASRAAICRTASDWARRRATGSSCVDSAPSSFPGPVCGPSSGRSAGPLPDRASALARGTPLARGPGHRAAPAAGGRPPGRTARGYAAKAGPSMTAGLHMRPQYASQAEPAGNPPAFCPAVTRPGASAARRHRNERPAPDRGSGKRFRPRQGHARRTNGRSAGPGRAC